MMRLLALFLAVSAAAASKKYNVHTFNNTDSRAVKGPIPCEGCLDFAKDGIEALLNAIGSGIPNTCSDLCNKAFSSEWEVYACDAICGYIGIKEFLHYIDTTDISPIWLCMEVDACPKTTCTTDCVTYKAFAASPETAGPPGHITFRGTIEFGRGVGTVTTVVGMAGVGTNMSWGADTEALFIDPPAGTTVPFTLVSTLEIKDGMGLPLCPPPGPYVAMSGTCLGACGDKFKTSGPIIGQSYGIRVTVTEGNGCM